MIACHGELWQLWGGLTWDLGYVLKHEGFLQYILCSCYTDSVELVQYANFREISSCKHEVQFGVRREAILPPPMSSGTTAGPEKPVWFCSSAVVCGTKWQPQPRFTPMPRLPWVLAPHPQLPPHHPQPALPRSSDRSPHPQAPLAEHTEKFRHWRHGQRWLSINPPLHHSPI